MFFMSSLIWNSKLTWQRLVFSTDSQSWQKFLARMEDQKFPQKTHVFLHLFPSHIFRALKRIKYSWDPVFFFHGWHQGGVVGGGENTYHHLSADWTLPTLWLKRNNSPAMRYDVIFKGWSIFHRVLEFPTLGSFFFNARIFCYTPVN